MDATDVDARKPREFHSMQGNQVSSKEPNYSFARDMQYPL